MRMTSSDFSRRLCAFSVLSARILYATSGSGSTSATTDFAPFARSAARRWFPFGVQYFPSLRTAMIGSRKRPSAPSTPVSRLTCASERSRWNGVGSTVSIGSAARTCQCPPSGSR